MAEKTQVLNVFVWDDECTAEEGSEEVIPWLFEVPLDTPWADINTAVRLCYPTSTKVMIEVDYASEDYKAG